ncbi:6,7-dimethyl-8-ribityllumazine synthase [Sulfuriroseicoccus oceanibius]|uniref:6,7-dimethyl-8-ribityllumazine synthase n=1 Tax=Sulfuriroseicoccus oceanibius TaxID=2707525 RepID=A0A6B3L4R8_9BACT|nr:6,7-dimethyl-8-ribityllumazine synthase [Sulfuriroseicoccus oceanibius]QQL43805.1 6,7-dimethyl-8-ribityllumazine synthase [Sulfuriroseicoccus oceanibius]
MSDFQLPIRPRTISKRRRIAVVASRFNSAFTDALVETCCKVLTEEGGDVTIDLHHVPGAFEIPVAVEAVARHSQVDAVIALGVILRGSTQHGDLIAESVTNALQTTANTHLVPVIHEVLLVNNEEQAAERTMGDKLNRGREAARAALQTIETMAKITKSAPSASL